MKGKQLFPALKKALCEDGESATDSALARSLGYVPANIAGLNYTTLTPTITANIIKRARKAGKSETAKNWVKTLVEFYPVSPTASRQERRKEILNKNDKLQRPLYDTLRATKSGLYSFYNSEGNIIYLGKTKNELWLEMNGAFNRNMEAHEVWIVDHPKKRAFARAHRRIRRRNVHLYDTAAYFSAYEVDADFVDRLETLFIRTLPNNLTNVRIEGQTDRSVEKPRERAAKARGRKR